MMIVSDPDVLSTPPEVTALLWTLSAWAGDPVVMTAIASLLTAIAAFFRARQRRAIEPGNPSSHPPHPETALSRAYTTLHEVEESIREELLQQLQHLQEETERMAEDLANHRYANTILEGAILRCPEQDCPVRDSLQDAY